LKLVEDIVSRKVQSATDKAMNRVEKVLAAAQQQGLNLTNAQAEKIADAIETEKPAGGGAGGKSPAPDAQAEPLHPVIATALEMQQAAGVRIEGNDPEVQIVDRETTDPVVFLQSIQAAIEAKRARLAQAGSPARIAAAGNASGAAGGSKGQLTAELTRLLAEPQKNWNEIKKVKAQLARFNT
jgi:hypothetical protein